MRLFVVLAIACIGLPLMVTGEEVGDDAKLVPMYVIAETGLNMRAGPGAQYKVISVLPCGRMVYLIEDNDGWMHITLPEADIDSTAWVSGSYLSIINHNCPDINLCHDCGRATGNPPGVFGYSMCSRCMMNVNDEAHRKLKQIESGQDYTCEFCGSYAARGKGMCNSCIKEAGKLLGGG